MTTVIRTRFIVGRRRISPRQAFWRATTLAMPLVAALAVAPAVPVGTMAESDGVPGALPLRAPVAAQRAARAAVPPRVDFVTVADILAKRYRVSSRATVELVRTAYREANRNGVDPLLVLAVMAIESSFNPIAESDGGAVGLMQIVPRFHEDKLASREGSALDPSVNIQVGTQVLREYIRRAGTEAAGLQLYNGSADDPASAYANKVLSERERLRQALKRAEANRA